MRSGTYMVTSILLGATSLAGVQLVRIHEPLEISMPAETAQRWSKPLTRELDRSVCEVPNVHVSWSVGATTTRLDVLVRDGSAWRWSFGKRVEDGGSICLPSLPGGARVGILVRDLEQSGLYAWAEVDPQKLPHPIELKQYKSVVVTPREASDQLLLVLVDEQEPRVAQRRGHAMAFSFVPKSASLLCWVSGDDSGGCSRVEMNSVEAHLDRQSSEGIRLVRLESNAPAEIVVSVEGRSLARPRRVPFSSVELKPWTAIGIAMDQSWSDVVVDLRSPGIAAQRLAGETLLPPPFVAHIPAIRDRGFAVRAVIARHEEPLAESEATLLIFPQSTGAAGRIPIGAERQAADGLFHFTELPAGQYRLRLISSLSDSRDIVVSLAATTEVATVEFGRGIVVTGQLLLSAGGSSPASPLVQVIRASRITSAESKQGIDPADALRQVSASPNGRFEFAVPIPGAYTLRAVWGNGRAEKSFVVEHNDLDLGDISLSAAATVRGRVRGCPGGELHFVPLPDLEQSQRSGFFDYVRAPIDQEGSFFVDNIAAGRWLATARCKENTLQLEPNNILIPATGDLITDFVARN